MSTVDELFASYRAAYEAGEADPRPYLARVSGADRRELAALIDGFLTRVAPPPFDPAQQDPLTSRAVGSLMAQMRAETWRTLLPAAEAAAGLSRAEVVDRLARALGVADKRDKVHLRYHEMERGRLVPERVRPRVLESLAAILGLSVERLREAGLRMAPPPPAAPAASVFARSVALPPDVPAHAPAAEPEDERWDEVDDLFQGG